MALTIAAACLLGGSTYMFGGQGAEPSSAARLPVGVPGVVAGPSGATSPAASATPAASESPTTAPTGSDDDPGPDPGFGKQPVVIRVPYSAKGRYKVVKGGARPPAGRRGKVIRYLVEVERGLPFDPEEFAAMVHRTLNDPRSWGRGRTRFKRVAHGPVRFRVALSSPALTNRNCRPLQTFGELSCWNGGRSVINAKRWGAAVPGYHGDLIAYRQYVINHEVGHALGHGHQPCAGRGRLAPVMTQQTKSLQGCRPNPWPFPPAKSRSRDAR
ncbi:DUF3152 domain-containing protein [Sphaerisporangium dianthi]|uniref:DUF3152 domain-containing protein n=1 Tax=Sphaerisporangium dianthi TaxID=1436120 RepID=A0ABV9C8A6_9ACTN